MKQQTADAIPCKCGKVMEWCQSTLTADGSITKKYACDCGRTKELKLPVKEDELGYNKVYQTICGDILVTEHDETDNEIAQRVREEYLSEFTREKPFLDKDHEVYCIWLKGVD